VRRFKEECHLLTKTSLRLAQTSGNDVGPYVPTVNRHGLATFTVLHLESDRFAFWITAARAHTVCSVTVRFREVDEIAYEYLCSFRRSNIAPPYTGMTTKG
jgi:hypothetical protein